VWNGLKNHTQFLASTFRSLRQDLSLFQAHVITCFGQWKEIVTGHTKWSGGPPVVQPWAEISLRGLCECNNRIGMKFHVLDKLVSVRCYFLLSICTGRGLCVRLFVCLCVWERESAFIVCLFFRFSACFRYVLMYLYFCAGLFVFLCPCTSSHIIPDSFNTNHRVSRFRPLNLTSGQLGKITN
jgi:hypothetical protein